MNTAGYELENVFDDFVLSDIVVLSLNEEDLLVPVEDGLVYFIGVRVVDELVVFWGNKQDGALDYWSVWKQLKLIHIEIGFGFDGRFDHEEDGFDQNLGNSDFGLGDFHWQLCQTVEGTVEDERQNLEVDVLFWVNLFWVD